MINTEIDRYSRQIMLEEFGTEGQKRLQSATVLIVGVGGLGSAVAPYLAGAGVGRLILTDSDTVSLSNLQRQILYSEEETGLKKTEIAAKRLRKLNSGITIEVCDEGLTPENAERLIGCCDAVVDCCDNYKTRILIDDVCATTGKPWIYGSIGEFSGQLSVFNHKKGKRYRELFPDIEHLCKGQKRITGVLGPVAGTIGALEAAECIKLLAGTGETAEGKLLTIDFLNLTTETVEF